MKIILSILLFVWIAVESDYFRFKQPVVKEIKKIEKDYKSKQFKLKSKVYVADDFFPNAGTYELEQPLVFVRSDKSFHVEPEVKYYYTPDDTVRLITHSWDTKGVSKKIKFDEDFSKAKKQDIEQWNQKFDDVQKEITSNLGQPTDGTGKFENKSKVGYGDWKERNVKWETGDCTTELKMIWTEQEMQLSGGARLVPTFRIRTKTYWN